MGLLGPATSIVKGALGGVAGFLGDPPSTTTTNQNTQSSGEQNSNFNNFSNQNFTTWLASVLNGSQSQAGTSSTNFNLDPATQALLTKLTGRYSNLAQPFNSQAYQSGQIQGINQNADIAKQAAENTLAARGVSGPAAATTTNNIDANRFASINQMEAQTPFVQQQFDLNNLGASAAFLNSIPKGTTTSTQSTGETSQSSNQQGNQTQSATSGGTGYTSSRGATNTTGTSTTQRKGGLGAGLAGIAAGLFG